MAKSRKRGVKLHKDQREVIIREIGRCFDEDGRLHFDLREGIDRFTAVFNAVMDRISRPWRISASQWRDLVWLRLKTIKRQGVMQIAKDRCVAWLSRNMTRGRTLSDTRQYGRGRPHASREGRRVYVNRHGYGY